MFSFTTHHSSQAGSINYLECHNNVKTCLTFRNPSEKALVITAIKMGWKYSNKTDFLPTGLKSRLFSFMINHKTSIFKSCFPVEPSNHKPAKKGIHGNIFKSVNLSIKPIESLE